MMFKSRASTERASCSWRPDPTPLRLRESRRIVRSAQMIFATDPRAFSFGSRWYRAFRGRRAMEVLWNANP